MINCIFAERLSDTVTECRNFGKSHIKQAAQAYCYRCKHRIPVNKTKFDDFVDLVEKKQSENNPDDFTYSKNVNGYRFSDVEFC